MSGGTTLYLAGYGMFTDEAGKNYAGDFDAQVRMSFARIRETLEKAGGKLDDIVTMTVFITDMANGTVSPNCAKNSFKKASTQPAR